MIHEGLMDGVAEPSFYLACYALLCWYPEQDVRTVEVGDLYKKLLLWERWKIELVGNLVEVTG